jgi:hypothetical protein
MPLNIPAGKAHDFTEVHDQGILVIRRIFTRAEQVQAFMSTLFDLVPPFRHRGLLFLPLGDGFDRAKGNKPNLFLDKVASLAYDYDVLLLNFRRTFSFGSDTRLPFTERSSEKRDVDIRNVVALI